MILRGMTTVFAFWSGGFVDTRGFVDRCETTLKQMTSPPATRIDEVGISSMRFAQRPAHAVCVLRLQDQVDMVGHQFRAAAGVHEWREFRKIERLAQKNTLENVKSFYFVRAVYNDASGVLYKLEQCLIHPSGNLAYQLHTNL